MNFCGLFSIFRNKKSGVLMKTSYRLLLLVISLISLQQLHSQPLPKDLDQVVESILKEFEVPGLCVAIVKDGKTILTKGYGVRTLGASEKVDEKTLFGIASNSKAFTATALAMLQEEGKLNWDDKVIDFLPWFRLSDAYITKEMTVRDLLTHRSGLGLGAGDLLWWPESEFTRHEINLNLKNLPLKYSFRSTYAYDNVLYIIAGELIEAVSGMSWEEFITKKIFNQIGFEYSTLIQYSDAEKNNVAATHAIIDGKLQIVKPFLKGNSNPAAGINSCAADMAKWLLVQLDSGKINNEKRLFTARSARQLWSLITPIPVGKASAELAPSQSNFAGYGLGFGIRDYRGQKMVSHTGGLPGYLSRVTLLPDLQLGIAVLTNQESGEAFTALSNYIMDYYLNAPAWDWIGNYKKLKLKSLENLAAEKKDLEEKRNKDSKPSLPLKDYAGKYIDKWYGEILVSDKDGKYEISFLKTPSLKGELVHWQYDTFVARWYDRELRADAFINFLINPEGKIESAKMRAVSSETDFSFDFHDLLLERVNAED